jgi:hypothetical protein
VPLPHAARGWVAVAQKEASGREEQQPAR